MLVLLTAMLPTASGQSTTGRISGTVLDPQSAVVPEATVTLTNSLTGQTREMSAGSQGEFVFTQLFAGTYEISVTAPGFKVYQQKDIQLSANEAVALRNVQLEIGTTTETVEVTAEAAHVETQSSERTALISTTQVEDLAIAPDRSYIYMLRLLPGVIVHQSQGDLPTIGGQMEVNGGKAGQVMVTLDGITDSSTESTWSSQGQINPNIDAINEVKVMLSNYTAEYGVRAGGTVNVSLKNGTREFHGSAYEYKRHEMFNAHEWQKDPPISEKSRYRYDNFGATLGGPVTFPGFNQDRDKLFFFVSLDWLRNVTPSGPLQLRFPTDDERNGDFSKTETSLGVIQQLMDPDPSATQPISGNVVPQSRINAIGQNMLKWYPQPTQGVTWTADGSQYNYYDPVGYTRESPKNQQIIRIDWNAAPKTLIYGRFLRSSNPQKNPTGNDSISMSGFPVLGTLYNPKAFGWGTTWVQTFSNSLVNEATVGFTKGITEQTPYAADLENVNSSKIGFTQFHPEINPLKIMPMWGFSSSGGGGGPPPGPPPGGGGPPPGGGAPPGGGGGSAAVIVSPAISGSAARFLHHGDNTLWNITDNLSWVKGRHSLKFGFYAEIVSRNSNRESDFTGTFSFDASDTANPLNTGLGMANAIMGYVTKYTESDKSQYSQARYNDIEFYVQDSWRVTRRLTLDIGIRFQNIAPTKLVNGGQMAMFLPDLYNKDTAMKYYIPSGPGGSQSYDPITGDTLPSAVYQGSFALPASITDPKDMFPAVKIFDGTYLNNPGMLYSPRFGFAYDILGNGKMAIRGGFGMFYDRSGGDETQSNYMQVPPLQNLMSIYYSTIPQIQSAGTLKLYGPGSMTYAVRAGQADFSAPGSYNWSLGVQRDMGLGLVLDVSYVGTVGRHQRRGTNINPLNYGTHFQDWALNPYATKPGPPDVPPENLVYPDFLLRPYQGYDVISYYKFDGTSNYHSMQMTLNRRFGTRFTLGGNWVWSKVMDYDTQYEAGFPTGHPDFMPDSFYYGKADSDHTHNVMLNFTYSVPSLSSHLNNNIIAKGIFDGWMVSGIGSFISGSPSTVSYSLSDATVDITGAIAGGDSGVPTRVSISGNPLRSSQTGLQSQLNSAVIAVPEYGKGICQYGDPYTCGVGNASRWLFTGPGTNNWDMTFYKSFQLGSNESRSLEFRCETYNTFNHTQFSGVNTSATFNAATGDMTAASATLGEYTSAASARKMVFSLRLRF